MFVGQFQLEIWHRALTLHAWVRILSNFYFSLFDWAGENTTCFIFFFAARKTDIIRVTELILDAINSGDFEAYTYVYIDLFYFISYTFDLFILFFSESSVTPTLQRLNLRP